MKTLSDCSVDAVVTDPPYGLSFMGKKWDYDVPSVEIWREVFRVLKPGGHVLSFGGTRTYHRMVVNIEDAGFEIRDQVQWIYGSGFPKSHNVSKAIDKMAGVKGEEYIREDFAKRSNKIPQRESQVICGEKGIYNKPATPAAKTWDGWGSALKPANEPICLARKPLEKGLTLAENVLKYGTGAINIDGTRIEAADQSKFEKNWDRVQSEKNESGKIAREGGKLGAIDLRDRAPQGRWPSNLLLDEEAAAMLDAQSGTLKSGALNKGHKQNQSNDKFQKAKGERFILKNYGNDSGGASRFFYVAKASKAERNRGLEGMPGKFTATMNDGIGAREHNEKEPSAYNQNFHPTVKPIKLMQYLITLITPPGGKVLDPFMGSGSTGVAAKNLNRNFIGCEMSPEYFEIAKKRIDDAKHI